MQEHMRPDLRQIMPRPWVREIADRALAFAPILSVPEVSRGEDFLVDVDRHNAPSADEPGFDLHTAQTVARRVKQALAHGTDARSLHRFDGERLQRLQLQD